MAQENWLTKISAAVVLAAILGFAGVAWAMAIKGSDKADKAVEEINDDRLRIVRLETQYSAVLYRLDELKSIAERQSVTLEKINYKQSNQSQRGYQ